MKSKLQTVILLALAAFALAATLAMAPVPVKSAVLDQPGQYQVVLKPKPTQVYPAGVTAICKDGTYSYSQSKRGTCSHHGGVKKWLKKVKK
jgi:hypothetical protein